MILLKIRKSDLNIAQLTREKFVENDESRGVLTTTNVNDIIALEINYSLYKIEEKH